MHWKCFMNLSCLSSNVTLGPTTLMVECEPTDLTGQSAFAFAIRPFNIAYNDNHCLLSLPSPTETHGQDSDTSSHLSIGSSVTPTCGMYHEDDQQSHPGGIHMNKTHGPIARLHRTQVQTMLMRCQMLQNTQRSVARRPWAVARERLQVHYAEEVMVLAYQAGKLAESLQDNGLQARCEYCAGCACLGIDDAITAVSHFKRAQLLDLLSRGTDTSEKMAAGLRPQERRHLDILLRAIERAEAGGEAVSIDGLRVTLHPLSPPRRDFITRELIYIKHGNKVG